MSSHASSTCVMSIDAGTESVRVGVFSLDGDLLATAASDYPTTYPGPGWAEQDPDNWWSALLKATRTCLGQTAVQGKMVFLALVRRQWNRAFCMLEFGETRPASGAEHHMSHFWEMKLLQEDRPALLHGAKVGAATVIVARRYEQIRRLTRSQVIEKLKAVPMPRRDQEIEHIRAAYHPRPAGQIITAHAPFLNISPLEYDQLCEKIVKHWTDIQQIAMTVPAADTLAGWLRAAGGTVDPQAMALSEDEVRLAAANGHYLRNRFTIAKLSRMLGMQ